MIYPCISLINKGECYALTAAVTAVLGHPSASLLSAEMDECLSAANSTRQGKARSPLQHGSCLKVGPPAPPPSTASHL